MKYLWLAIGFAAGLSVGLTIGWFKGRSDFETKIHNQMQSKQIKVFKDGKQIDEKVFSADDVGLCDMLGSCELRNDGVPH